MSQIEDAIESNCEITGCERASQAIVQAIADANGVEPTDLDPLYYAVDAEALDALVASSANAPTTAIRFRYHGYDVTVTGDGTVTLEERSCDDPSLGEDVESDDG